MPALVNKFGLSREIPAPTKRAIRQECGYGCVICGCGVYQYEHITPEWHKATAHLVSKMALLCGKCHDLVSRKFYTKEKILKARLSPYCKRSRFAWIPTELTETSQSTIHLGSCSFVNTRTVLRMFGEDLIQISPAELGGPVRISARFFDAEGHPSLDICENEYRIWERNWDVETGEGRFLIRRRPRDIALQLRIEGPNHVTVERLKMSFEGCELQADSHGIWLGKSKADGVGFAGKVVEADCAIEVAR